jgi:GDP-4-dehydro-6-deoxy-D-mannose reductase
MKKLLIVGSSGFSGCSLATEVRRAAGGRIRVFGADQRGSGDAARFLDGFCRLDASRGRDVRRLIGKLAPDLVVNLVGTFSASSYERYMRVNVDTTRSILEACRDLGHVPEKILLVGSAAEYGIPEANPVGEDSLVRPVTLYGLSKLAQTHLGLFYWRAHGLPVVIARTFNITGEGVSPLLSVGSFAKQIAAARDGDTILVGNLESERDFLPVTEVASRYLVLLQWGVAGTIYNVCSGKPKRLRELVGEMIRDSGKKISVVVDPARLRKGDIPCIYGDSRRLDALAGPHAGGEGERGSWN